MTTVPWSNWTATDDIECYFSREQANRNAGFLAATFAGRWPLKSGCLREPPHPILKLWHECSATAFLLLNSLAEDLRLIIHRQNVGCVLRDLEDERSYEAARHTIHVAALFERAKTGAVVRFLEARNERAADFVVKLGAQEIPVEAKLLMKSEVQEQFTRSSKIIVDALLNEFRSGGKSVAVLVVQMDALAPPAVDEVMRTIRPLLPVAGPVQCNMAGCKMWIEPLPEDSGIAGHRAVHVLAPLHEREYLRIRDRASNASKQLRAATNGGSGILALGLTRQQDPHAVISLLASAMSKRRLRAIGAALLVKTGTCLASPRRSIVDLLEVRTNNDATRPIATAIPLRPLDLCAKLTDAEPAHLDRPSYQYAATEGRIVDVTRGGVIGVRDIRRIASRLLG